MGGQILRNSISLSAILGIPVRVKNIRAGRKKPGLAAQHLKGIQLVAEMCQAKLSGAHIGSTDIQFIPGKIRGGHYFADIQTAGSISLLLQVALPCALMADSPVILDLKGGTNVDMAPQIDYMNEIFRENLKQFGAKYYCTVIKRGYFPRGGGHVEVTVKPIRSLKSVTFHDRLCRGPLFVNIRSFVAGKLPVKIAYEMANGAKDKIAMNYPTYISCKKDQQSMGSNCSGILVWTPLATGCVLGVDGLFKGSIDPLEVGEKIGADFMKLINSSVSLDSYAQDQMIIYMCLADGESIVHTGEITLHTKTAIHIAETIAKTKFTIRPDGDENFIQCSGLGFFNKNIT
ncbi:RNA 3'-terminal phosphate cyclase isoform X2 [Pieris rapae]|uniref:RNA 3'-terminal phosphate cyclase isoform X2 n=1 Tax=Pieris rapae TaxID=64459 RepID=UPI001E27AB5E|nr:RNA 3'-terminal phosphate cyclase isoform X2 [Pieris rapae]